MANALAITTMNDEARVLDTDLATSLGMAQPLNVRSQIFATNRAELEGFGPIFTLSVKIPGKAGRPATAYYLNEEQALLVYMLARTDKAREVRGSVIKVFTAYRHGQLLAFAAPTSMKEALMLALQQCERIEQLTAQDEVLTAEKPVVVMPSLWDGRTATI